MTITSPLAKALRERGHKNRIGFFLHIPCPPPEMLTALPHHERLIPLLCDYDLIGFQTGDDAFNFSRYLTRECGLHSRDFNFVVADRTVSIGAFPVGIETAAFAGLAQNSIRLPFVQRVIKSLDGRALIIGVDRLDYSKGIAERLSAFERFLERQAEWRGKVTYLQIAPKSRTEIPEYADIEQEIGAAAERINGAYGDADWTPVVMLIGPTVMPHSEDFIAPHASRWLRRCGTVRISWRKNISPRKIPMTPVCLFYHVSLARHRNAKQRSWSIHTILTASRQLLGRRFRCLWLSGASATPRCFERFYATT